MICDDFLFLLIDHATTALWTKDNLFNGFSEFWHINSFFVTACGEDGSFIDQVSEVSARKSRSTFCNHTQLHGFSNGFVFCMDHENLFAFINIGEIHSDTTIKTSRTKQRRTKHVWRIGSRNDDYTGICFKSIHFNENLIQCLFSFIVSTAQSCAAMTSHSINFINKNNRRSVFLSLFEEIADTTGTNTDK